MARENKTKNSKTPVKSVRKNLYTTWRKSGMSKPPIKVKGRMGKPQKRKARNSVKKINASTVDYYDSDISNMRGAKIREDKNSSKVNRAPKSLQQSIPNGVRRIMLAQQAIESGIPFPKRSYVSNDGETTPIAKPQKSKNAREADTDEPLKTSSDNKRTKVHQDLYGMGRSRKKEKYLEYQKKKLAKQKKNTEPPLRDYTEFTDLKDEVQFGEVTSRPPLNLAKPRNSEPASSKTKFQTLKLAGMLEDESKNSSQPKKSLHQQYLMNEERQRAIDLYRARNRKKYKHLI